MAPPPRISLGAWFARELEPGDLDPPAPDPPARRVAYWTGGPSVIGPRPSPSASPSEQRLQAARNKFRQEWAKDALRAWSRYSTANAKLRPIEAGPDDKLKAGIAPRLADGSLANRIRLPGDPTRLPDWPHHDVQVEDVAAGAQSDQRLRSVARDVILAELIDFQRSPPDGPADRATACWVVAWLLHTSLPAVRRAFKDLPAELRKPAHRPRSLQDK